MSSSGGSEVEYSSSVDDEVLDVYQDLLADSDDEGDIEARYGLAPSGSSDPSSTNGGTGFVQLQFRNYLPYDIDLQECIVDDGDDDLIDDSSNDSSSSEDDERRSNGEASAWKPTLDQSGRALQKMLIKRGLTTPMTAASVTEMTERDGIKALYPQQHRDYRRVVDPRKAEAMLATEDALRILKARH